MMLEERIAALEATLATLITTPTRTLEERVAALEAAVAAGRAKPPKDIRNIVGIFADDPDFERAAAFGRFFRQHGRLPEEGESLELTGDCAPETR